MKIKAKFKGRDGSLGYRNGGNYTLKIRTVKRRKPMTDIVVDRLAIERMENGVAQYSGACEYDSLKAFLNNWQVLS